MSRWCPPAILYRYIAMSISRHSSSVRSTGFGVVVGLDLDLDLVGASITGATFGVIAGH